MASRSCVSGCGQFLASSDGDDRCPPCLGYQHAEAALRGSCTSLFILLFIKSTVYCIAHFILLHISLFIISSYFYFLLILYIYSCVVRAVTVADFYHRGGNGPTTAGGAVL